MPKLTDKEWLRIKSEYEIGKGTRELSRDYSTAESTIRSRAKKDGWIRALIAQEFNAQVSVLSALAITSDEIKNKVAPAQLAEIEDLIIQKAVSKSLAFSALQEAVAVMREATKVGQAFVLAHPDGLYVKSETASGTSYGRTTEVISDLSAITTAANQIINGDKAIVDVTNNTQNNNQEPIIFNIQPVRVKE